VIAVVALGGLVLTGCGGGRPDSKRVALDVIETMGTDHEGGTLTEAQQLCMANKVENDYTEEELSAIGNANLELDRPDADFETEGTPELQRFVADLAECTAEGTETATSTSETGSTTDGGETGTTTASSGTTVPATTTAATEG
jgi:hypothetical protein